MPRSAGAGLGTCTRLITEDRPSATEVVKDAILAAIDAFHAANQDPARALDEEATHDARVAMRRLRSILRTYDSLFDDTFITAARSDLRWYGSLLGDVRDLDVTAERLQPYLDENRDESGWRKLVGYLTAERERALDALRVGRSDTRYQIVLYQLDRLDEVQPLAAEARDDDLVPYLRRPLRRLIESAKTAEQSERELDLHELRIRAKELRYAAELSEDVLGATCHALARYAKDLQDAIGEHRDARRTMQFLEEFERFYGQHPAFIEHITESERSGANRAIVDYEDDLKKIERAWHRLRHEARHDAKVSARCEELPSEPEHAESDNGAR